MSGIVWWEVETPDPARFQRFHSALWGWSFSPAFADTELGADYWLIQVAGQGIGGVQRRLDHPHPPAAGTRVYLEVEDLEATFDRVVEHGGLVERRRTELGGGDRWFGVFTDPTGISFGLWTAHPARTP